MPVIPKPIGMSKVQEDPNDSAPMRMLKSAGRFLGIDDPNSQVLGMANPLVTGPVGGIIGAMGKAMRTNPTKGAIKADPFGLKDGPMDRRVFLDRLRGNHIQRATSKEQELLKTFSDSMGVRKRTEAGYQVLGEAPQEVISDNLEKHAAFVRQFDSPDRKINRILGSNIHPWDEKYEPTLLGEGLDQLKSILKARLK